MKKIMIIMMILLSSVLVNAQQVYVHKEYTYTDEYNNPLNSGELLSRGAVQLLTGTCFGAASVIPILLINDKTTVKEKEAFMFISGTMAIVGVIHSIQGAININRAGKIMQLNANDDGIGIKININNK